MDDKRMADKDCTRPQDWAPAARVHLFGMNTLSREEFAVEGTRMSGGRAKYGDAVYREAIEAQRRGAR